MKLLFYIANITFFYYYRQYINKKILKYTLIIENTSYYKIMYLKKNNYKYFNLINYNIPLNYQQTSHHLFPLDYSFPLTLVTPDN